MHAQYSYNDINDLTFKKRRFVYKLNMQTIKHLASYSYGTHAYSNNLNSQCLSTMHA